MTYCVRCGDAVGEKRGFEETSGRGPSKQRECAVVSDAVEGAIVC